MPLSKDRLAQARQVADGRLWGPVSDDVRLLILDLWAEVNRLREENAVLQHIQQAAEAYNTEGLDETLAAYRDGYPEKANG